MDEDAYHVFMAKISELQVEEAREREELKRRKKEGADLEQVYEKVSTSGKIIAGEALDAALTRAQREAEEFHLILQIEEMKQVLAKAVEKRREVAMKLQDKEERIARNRRFYSAKKKMLQAEQVQVDAWFTNKPRWKLGVHLREESDALDAKLIEVNRSPNPLEKLLSEIQEKRAKVNRLEEAFTRSEQETKDLRAGRAVVESEIAEMRVQAREADERKREMESMIAEDIAAQHRIKAAQEMVVIELQRQVQALREQVAQRGQQLDEKRRRLLAEKNRFFQSASLVVPRKTW